MVKVNGLKAMLCAHMRNAFLVLLLSLAVIFPAAAKEPLRVAVASNFRGTLEKLAPVFKKETGIPLAVTAGASGTLYAQIKAGAPFDIFLSAESFYAEELEKNMAIAPGTRMTYAIGKLVFWAPKWNGKFSSDSIFFFRTIAVADPKLAPYGKAAKELLQKWGAWNAAQPKLHFGNSIATTFHMIKSGAVQGGFIALSQAKEADLSTSDYWQIVPGEHSPIIQQGIAITNIPIAIQFLEFLKSEKARRIISRSGYDLP